jgi:PhnB protein
MQVQSYLIFNGRCEEAIEFYKKSLGAKVEMLMRFKENPDKEKMGAECVPPGGDDKVMHSSFKIGETVVMASDGMSYDQKPEFKGFSLTVTAKNEAEADKLFNALSDGGKVNMPLGKTFFSPRFGMVADKFGVGWMVIVPQPM